MAAIEALVAPLSSQIWYTQAAGETEIIDFGTDVPFEPGIKDHKFNEELGVFVIDFEGPLKKIKDKAFKNSPIVSIVLPEGLETIGKEAFEKCSSLKTIIIPKSVEIMGYHAFIGCTSLKILVEASKESRSHWSLWNIDQRPVKWDYKKQ
jgi:hypothetical protein